MHLARIGTVLVAVASVARTWTVEDALPARVASHFDAAGLPNGWIGRDGLLALHAALMTLMVGLFVAVPSLLGRVPVRLVNLPHRDHWLAPERRTATLATIEAWMGALGLLVVVALAIFEELVVRANLPGGGGRLLMVPFWATLLTVVGFAIAWTVRFGRMWRAPPR